MGLADEIDDAVQRHLAAPAYGAGASVEERISLLEEAQRLRVELIEVGRLLDDVLRDLAASQASSSG